MSEVDVETTSASLYNVVLYQSCRNAQYHPLEMEAEVFVKNEIGKRDKLGG